MKLPTKPAPLWAHIIVAVAIIAGWVGYNALAYDDWTCAFSRCVKVENVKP